MEPKVLNAKEHTDELEIIQAAIWRPNNIWVFSSNEQSPDPDRLPLHYQVFTYVSPDQPTHTSVANTEGQTGHVATFSTSIKNGFTRDILARQLVSAWGLGIRVTASDDVAYRALLDIADYIRHEGFIDRDGNRWHPTGEGLAGIKIYEPGTLTPEPLRPAKGRQAQKLRPTTPQQTSPEIKEATIAMADAPLLRGWDLIDGEIALRHCVKDSPHQVKFVIGPLVQWLGRPNTVESLWDELRAMGLPAALLYHVVIAELLEHGSTMVALDSLITAIGWDPRSTTERQEMRQTLWRWIVCFVSWEIVGKRKSIHKDPVTKQALDLATFTPMIRLGERGYNANTQIALDYSTPPFEVELEASSWLNQFRGNDNVLWYFGDVRRLANIKAGKPSGAWAQAIGLALQQLWRERASRAEVIRVGDDHKPTVRFSRPFTRRELLNLFPPSPTADDVLNGPNPKRAQSYWADAIGLLKEQDVIGHYEEPKRPLPRQGWAKDWLDQPLDIRPTRDGIAAVAEIATRKREADKRRKRAQGRVAAPSA